MNGIMVWYCVFWMLFIKNFEENNNEKLTLKLIIWTLFRRMFSSFSKTTTRTTNLCNVHVDGALFFEAVGLESHHMSLDFAQSLELADLCLQLSVCPIGLAERTRRLGLLVGSFSPQHDELVEVAATLGQSLLERVYDTLVVRLALQGAIALVGALLVLAELGAASLQVVQLGAQLDALAATLGQVERHVVELVSVGAHLALESRSLLTQRVQLFVASPSGRVERGSLHRRHQAGHQARRRCCRQRRRRRRRR